MLGCSSGAQVLPVKGKAISYILCTQAVTCVRTDPSPVEGIASDTDINCIAALISVSRGSAISALASNTAGNVCKIVKRVSAALASLLPQYVAFPSNEQLKQVSDTAAGMTLTVYSTFCLPASC